MRVTLGTQSEHIPSMLRLFWVEDCVSHDRQIQRGAVLERKSVVPDNVELYKKVDLRWLRRRETNNLMVGLFGVGGTAALQVWQNL